MIKLDKTDRRILKLRQQDARMSTRALAKTLRCPMMTVYSKIKRLEKLGVIKGYTILVDGERVGMGATVFVLASFSYRGKDGKKLDQRAVCRQLATFDEIQEVHIIAGDWDILMKIKAENTKKVGEFVVDKLRLVEGIEKTLSIICYESAKESPSVPIAL